MANSWPERSSIQRVISKPCIGPQVNVLRIRMSSEPLTIGRVSAMCGVPVSHLRVWNYKNRWVARAQWRSVGGPAVVRFVPRGGRLSQLPCHPDASEASVGSPYLEAVETALA